MMRLTGGPAGLVLDGEVHGAVLYSLAVRGRAHGVSLHAMSVERDGVRLAFTAPSGARDDFLRAIRADLRGYLEARFGGPACDVELQELDLLGDAKSQVRALAEIAAEGGVVPF